MAITTSAGKNVDFLGLTGEVRENVLRALVGNLKTATWAYKTSTETVTGSNGSTTTREIFKPINPSKQTDGNKTFSTGWTVFQDSDDLGMLATDNGIWVKVYPTRGVYVDNAETGDINYDFCVYLTLSSVEPLPDGSNVVEPSTIDPDTGECDEPNFARFHLADGGRSTFLTICNSETDPDGNDGRNVNVVAAVNAAIQQEIKFNRSTKAWNKTYTHFALYTHPTAGRILAWGKLTNDIVIEDKDVVPLFEEGKFRLFFPAPNEIEAQVDAAVDSTEN